MQSKATRASCAACCSCLVASLRSTWRWPVSCMLIVPPPALVAGPRINRATLLVTARYPAIRAVCERPRGVPAWAGARHYDGTVRVTRRHPPEEPPTMPEFAYTDLLPLGPDTTQYRLLTAEGVRARQALGREFLEVDPEVLTLLAREGMRDIAHLLRPGHLRQLRSILDDPEASPNDRFVARDLLTNACIAAGGVLPMCQDTGTAIIMGKRGGGVLTDGRDEEHLARGVYDA